MTPRIIIYLLFILTSCGQTPDKLEKVASSTTVDTTYKPTKAMSDYSPTIEKAHPTAKRLMNEEFYWSPIEETAPFGSDEKLKPYLKRSDLGVRYMSGIDAAIVAIAFGQIYLEGTVDKDFNVLAKTAIKRQLIPEMLNLWGDDYKTTRETQLKKMLAVLNQVD